MKHTPSNLPRNILIALAILSVAYAIYQFKKDRRPAAMTHSLPTVNLAAPALAPAASMADWSRFHVQAWNEWMHANKPPALFDLEPQLAEHLQKMRQQKSAALVASAVGELVSFGERPQLSDINSRNSRQALLSLRVVKYPQFLVNGRPFAFSDGNLSVEQRLSELSQLSEVAKSPRAADLRLAALFYMQGVAHAPRELVQEVALKLPRATERSSIKQTMLPPTPRTR